MGDNRPWKCLKCPCISIKMVVDIAIWLTVGIPALFLFLLANPQQSGFFCDDTKLGYPDKPETISTPVLCVVGFSTFVVVIVLVEILNYIDGKYKGPYRRISSLRTNAKLSFYLLVGFAMEQLTVDAIKNLTGVPRPIFFEVCMPHFNRTLCPGYISQYLCTRNLDKPKILRDIRQSFPSGHAAFSMYIATFLCLFIARKLQFHFSTVLKFVLQFVLVFLAVLCGVGRVVDNRHHVSDVLAGLFIGASIAIFLFRQAVEKIIEFDKMETHVSEHSPQSKHCSCKYEKAAEEEPLTPSPSPLLQHAFFPSLNEEHENNRTVIQSSDIV